MMKEWSSVHEGPRGSQVRQHGGVGCVRLMRRHDGMMHRRCVLGHLACIVFYKKKTQLVTRSHSVNFEGPHLDAAEILDVLAGRLN